MSNINIIGLSGYAESGKSTVGNIIQYLDCKERFGFDYPYSDFIAHRESEWEVRGFSVKLKQIASLLTGIPVEKFEDQEFKKTHLGKEWDSTKVWPDSSKGKGIGGQTLTSSQEPLMIRKFLQLLGTDAIRNNVHENAWINALFADYEEEVYTTGIWGRDESWTQTKGNLPKWIITDVRFPNEAEAIKQRGGIVVRINRHIPLERYHTDENGSFSSQIVRLHPSETSLDLHNFDAVIDNNGSIDDLILEVKKMLQFFNIIS